ncbi:MAG TPA: MFS transporter [Methylomirabilota bacterium]|jgi:MFS family permease|nr:MFS transporter [Methylomirabilota bacterium]
MRPAYQWIVLGVSTAVNALAWSARSTFALFYIAMLEEFGWGRGPTALGYSLSWLCFVAFAPISGWLHDRWGARAVVKVGGLVLGLALVLTGRVTSLTEYYLCFGVLSAAGIACIVIPSTTIVTRWFVRSRGTAMGILSAGNPASAVAFYPVNAWLIVTLGWRGALVAFGCIVAAATVSLALLYREPPVDEERFRQAAAAGATRPARAEWTLRRAFRSSRLWAAFAMMALGVIGFQIMATHQVAHAVDRGVQHSTVVWLFAFGAACMMAGNLLGGWLSDQLGRGWVFALGSIVAVVGIGSLALIRGPHDLPLLLVYAISGFGFGMRIAQLSAIPADVFAGPHLGAILGVVQAGGGLGGAIGPFLGGWLFDVTGTYGPAFMAAGLAVAGSAIAAWFAARPPPDPWTRNL